MEDTIEQLRLGELNNGFDRISSLHVDLLHHILSFLPTTDSVVRTSILSKNWRYISRSIPSLYFNDRRYKRMSAMVDSMLTQREEINLEKLNLYINCSYFSETWINGLLEYAVRHNVRTLYYKNVWNGKLPSQLFTCKSLVHLTLCGDISIRLPTLTCLPALKTVDLQEVSFKEDQDLTLFSLLLSLETLTMHHCHFPPPIKAKKLNIYGPKLQKLDLEGAFPSSVEILAPDLVSLELYIYSKVAIRFNVLWSSMVDNAKINVKLVDFEAAKEVIRLLKNVQSLEMSARFLKSIVLQKQKDLSVVGSIGSPFYKLKKLEVETSFTDGEIFLIIALLKYSAIETLILQNIYLVPREHFENEAWVEGEMSNLERVSIYNFEGSENGMRFVENLLGKAQLLKKLEIGSSYSTEEKFSKKVLSYSRASSSVEITFTDEVIWVWLTD